MSFKQSSEKDIGSKYDMFDMYIEKQKKKILLPNKDAEKILYLNNFLEKQNCKVISVTLCFLVVRFSVCEWR